MKKNLLSVFSIGLIAVLFSATAFAQQGSRRTVSAASSLYVISAKAGGVNYVEGTVAVERKNVKGELLLKGDQLETGDKISTGTDGKAEILLNPGSFVRLAENSNFEFTTVSLDDLQLKLNGGSAIFEIITDAEFTVAVNTPKAKFNIITSGVYRIDVLDDGTGKIEVWKGKAQIGNALNAIQIKGGKQATVDGLQVAVAKFDRDDKDSLEIWSKTRAKELAKINARLLNQDVRTSLMSSFYRTRWSLYNSYGLWVYNSFYGSYCFLPFGYGWNSPYGYYYRRDIWQYNLPPVIYNAPPTNTTPQQVRGAGTLSDKIKHSPRGDSESGQTTRIIPPFQRIQRDIGAQFPTDRETDTQSFPTRIPSGQIVIPPPTSSPAPVIDMGATAPPRRGNN